MVTDLSELLAVKHHGNGISSAELAEFHQALANAGKERFVGVGSQQYESLKGQKFETMSSKQLTDELIEELIDVQNYVTMLAIKVIAALSRGK